MRRYRQPGFGDADLQRRGEVPRVVGISVPSAASLPADFGATPANEASSRGRRSRDEDAARSTPNGWTWAPEHLLFIGPTPPA
jgi:hypothetical protein